eukprot:2628338-Pleurochrysis_carterae.AAC.2
MHVFVGTPALCRPGPAWLTVPRLCFISFPASVSSSCCRGRSVRKAFHPARSSSGQDAHTRTRMRWPTHKHQQHNVAGRRRLP